MTGGEEGGGGSGAWKRGTSQRTHQLEGRKREEQVHELGNIACHKQQLANWRGGRRSGFVSLEMWHVTNKDSPTGGEEEGGAGRGAWKCDTSQTRTHQLEGRRMKEQGGEV